MARLFVYPVKSCAGIELSEAVLTEAGLDLDRAWMVVDD
ncbi:MAG: MOSC domain-containing protein, partial [Hylemonella sp.]|nr:MOSC domain-containing protein [Hylemonella sp.]